MHQITSVVSTGSPPLTFDWEDIMNSSSFVHYVRDQVIFISMTTIATILLFTLGLMAAASLDGKAQTAGIVGAVVIGLRRRRIAWHHPPPSVAVRKDSPEEQDTPFAREFGKPGQCSLNRRHSAGRRSYA